MSGASARFSWRISSTERDRSDGEQSARRRQHGEADLLRPLEGEQQRGDRHGEKDEPVRVGPPRPLPVQLAVGQPPSQPHRHQPDRQVDQEDRLPAEMLTEIAAGHRPESVGGDGDGGDVTLIARPLPRRDRSPDQRLRECHQPAAAQALQHTGGGEQFNRGRQRAQQRRYDENRERHEHQPPPAKMIAQPAVDRRGDRGGDQIADDDPGRALHIAGGRRDRRQRGRDDGLVDHRQEHRQHDRGKQREKAGILRRVFPRQAARLVWPVRQKSLSRSLRQFRRQCAMKTGRAACARMWRVAPPKIICRRRLCV